MRAWASLRFCAAYRIRGVWKSLLDPENPGQFAMGLLDRELRQAPLLQVREAFVLRIAGGCDQFGEAPRAAAILY